MECGRRPDTQNREVSDRNQAFSDHPALQPVSSMREDKDYSTGRSYVMHDFLHCAAVCVYDSGKTAFRPNGSALRGQRGLKSRPRAGKRHILTVNSTNSLQLEGSSLARLNCE